MLTPLDSPSDSPNSFSRYCTILGPFQIGTREATWGADPLESLGGFRSLKYDDSARFPSSLTKDGVVSWSTVATGLSQPSPSTISANIAVGFPEVDWTSLRSTYGWTALQYQAWARVLLQIGGSTRQTILLYTENVLEFWVDDKPYFGGDFYAYRNAPLVLHLDPGQHKLEVRLIRDVRAMGGESEPTVEVVLQIQRRRDHLALDAAKIITPDVVGGKLASNLACIPLRNQSTGWIEICGIETIGENFDTNMVERGLMKMAPGQTRPLAFNLRLRDTTSLMLRLTVKYKVENTLGPRQTDMVNVELPSLGLHESHKVTFLHPSKAVSYAILRPPSREAISNVYSPEAWPVMLNLHGAGVEADSDQVRGSFDAALSLRCWIVSPTGTTSWSGDDWHHWGFSDAEAAIAAIPTWIKAVNWVGPAVAVGKWLVVGHSNGGQGTWYAVTHNPDKIIGAAAVSGYSSIQAYVPYSQWTEADPRVSVVLQTALTSFRHELLLDNVTGIPVVLQHGGDDDNVPPFHSRRMMQLVSQRQYNSALLDYAELKEKGHWFDGVMTTPFLLLFYKNVLAGRLPRLENPQAFSIVVGDPAEMGSKHGLAVKQKIYPDQLGRVDVVIAQSTEKWNLKTSNILRFRVDKVLGVGAAPKEVVVDDHTVIVPSLGRRSGFDCIRLEDGSWSGSCDSSWRDITQRFGAQLGSMNAVLRTKGTLLIQADQPFLLDVALQISRNLHQYFRADTEIGMPGMSIETCKGNMVRLACGPELAPSILPSYPISVEREHGLSILRACGGIRSYSLVPGLGAAMLRPLSEERVELVIWGFDLEGLRYASRMLPMLTGVGQPDFVVSGKACGWKGAAGVWAMGFLDSFWKISESSYIT